MTTEAMRAQFEAASNAYDLIDRYLRNSMGDDDYAEYSEALNKVWQAALVDVAMVREIVERHIGKTSKVAKYIADDLEAALSAQTAEPVAQDDDRKSTKHWDAALARGQAVLAAAEPVAQEEAVGYVEVADGTFAPKGSLFGKLDQTCGLTRLDQLYTHPVATMGVPDVVTAEILGSWCNLLTHAWMYVKEGSMCNAWIAIEQVEKEMRDWQSKLAPGAQSDD